MHSSYLIRALNGTMLLPLLSAGAVAAGHGSSRGVGAIMDKLVDKVLGSSVLRRFMSPAVSVMLFNSLVNA
jgi:hypothetical protein